MKTLSEISAPDSLVGAIALEYVLLKFKPLMEDDDSRGAFHVLSGFSADQLVGFIRAKDAKGQETTRLRLQFPATALSGHDINPLYLTDDSAVGVRNQPRGSGLIVLTAEVENDAEASLADSDRTDASDLKDKNIAHIWVDFVSRNVKRALLPDETPKAEALLKGLFDTGRCPTTKVGEYLEAVLEAFKDEPLTRAAGRSLPIIGLPRFDDCFSSLNDKKMGQASQWAEKFKSHYTLECYVDKRGPSQELLDTETLRKTLARLLADEQQPPIPEDVLDAFSSYIDSEGKRNAATENLLFEFDWSYTRHCFDKNRRSSSKDFSDRTRKALDDEGVVPTDDDILVIESLKKVTRRSGTAPPDFREFFERKSETLEKDTKLFIEWEDYVHGKKIECFDLFQGIFECLQRTVRGLGLDESAYIELEGRRQSKPNSFMESNQRACEYFERSYGSLSALTNNKIRFKDTLVLKYSKEVLPKLKDKPKFKNAKKTTKAITLEFFASVFQTKNGNTGRKIGMLALTWKFPIESVLAQETPDFDAICRYHNQKATTLVHCFAEYEGVGRKGLPLSLSLQNTEGFADVVRGGGRGAFVPAQDRIKSLAADWHKLIKEGEALSWFSENASLSLQTRFKLFEEVYNNGVLSLRKDAMAHGYTAEIASAYRTLLLEINQLSHENARRSLLQILLSVGLAQVKRSGGRNSVAIVCPWHPLRMEATAARQHQLLGFIHQLLENGRLPFSDGASGALFFRELEQLQIHPLYPEMALIWENKSPSERVVAQAFSGYTLHHSAKRSKAPILAESDDGSASASATIEHEVGEYLRLQPHERDNLSILLYNCASPTLPLAVVKSINRINEKRDGTKITCQVLLVHRDEKQLRQIYRDIMSRGTEAEGDSTEATGDFLAKVRVNITAANRLRRTGRAQPVDIAYCRDLISNESEAIWEWVHRETVAPIELKPHQWSRKFPVIAGDRKVRLQLVCPAQTETGWTYLYAIAELCANGAEKAWKAGDCPVLMRRLDFDDQSVERIFKETHELATWVVNQDELLDRKLLEACQVKVIRYIQSATHGRNLIISSDARDTLLVNTLKEKIKAILVSETAENFIVNLSKKFIDDANRISGGLILKAARRANNTNELLGMVLSRYIVQSELGLERAIAWCFLDDYSQWLGKKEGAQIADLLVLAPTTKEDGSLHLDVIVTEAKFVTNDAVGNAASNSAKQLVDTLSQLAEALNGTAPTIDQDIWLARLSDLLILQTVTVSGKPALDAIAWRRAIRNRDCSFRIHGYSHVFVYEPQDYSAQESSVKGVPAPKTKIALDAIQEVFSPNDVRELLMQYQREDGKSTNEMRIRNGHPSFGLGKIQILTPKLNPKASHLTDSSVGNIEGNPNLLTDTSAIHNDHDSPKEEIKTVAVELPPENAVGTNGNHELISFLDAASSQFESSKTDGNIWLKDVTAQLRQALISRGLTAKLSEEFSPILTPNAGIIKLQGTKELTVQAIESRASEIFTSDGIQIISVMPESGRISIAVKRPIREILHTERVLLDYLKNFDALNAGESISIGIAEEDGKQILLDPLSQPHTLVAGITGSGKSILIQNILITIAASRSPDQALIYLIDPKFGLDYRPLEGLPHLKAGSGRIIDDTQEAIEMLKNLVTEMNNRYVLFKEAGVPNIGAYRRATGKKMPTLWVIHDEFTDWMMIEEYRKAVPDVVSRLSVKARAAGIFLIFAAQRPDKDAMPMQLRSQLGNRLILKVDNEATSEIAMGIKNGGAERLLGRGHMLVRIGQPDSIYAQVPFIDIETVVPEIVEIIQRQYRDLLVPA
ncbi:FtsK/SpoIIIE domain-containing protein [Herbaspirillum sp. RTI4]|uniref:FtsK/SpoIIIE domain-containing protein n=1 Tax=Herbaspirillum sp. RTI4 TaxID=3048640 RepID=UPI002AB439C9|nr:FtsK/SpoIIIE domain-containing protein [Herbaspirillum sp. RTI4]MDY7577266.1 FtsK/SpoIIIE domain-containing protein [Herbaspirillum sp. RTI4]MEA9980556.1 FtsK/SpoIIIE domain-containing protein [Herbaspirillum sp. RTI4]